MEDCQSVTTLAWAFSSSVQMESRLSLMQLTSRKSASSFGGSFFSVSCTLVDPLLDPEDEELPPPIPSDEKPDGIISPAPPNFNKFCVVFSACSAGEPAAMTLPGWKLVRTSCPLCAAMLSATSDPCFVRLSMVTLTRYGVKLRKASVS